MANKKISELSSASTLTGAELMELVQSSSNVSATLLVLFQNLAIFCNTPATAFSSSGSYPSSGGRFGGSIKKYDTFYITGTGTLQGNDISQIFTAMALVDTPGQTDSNWRLEFKH